MANKPKGECKVRGCHNTDADRSMAFKGEPYCCEDHRKILEKQGKL